MTDFRSKDHEKTFSLRAIAFCLHWLGWAHLFLQRVFLLVFGKWLGKGLSKISWSGRFALMSVIGAGIFFNFALFQAKFLLQISDFSPMQISVLEEADAFGAMRMLMYPSYVLSVLLMACVILAYIRKPIVFQILRVAAWSFFAGWIVLLFLAFGVPNTLLSMTTEELGFDGVMRNMLWFDYLWIWMPVCLLTIFFVLPMFLSRVKNYYGIETQEFERGDKFVESLQCKGRYPLTVRSSYWAFWYHFFVLLLLPLLLNLFVFKDAYLIPKGEGGTPVQQMIKVKPKPKKKPKKTIVLNPNSPILLIRPDIEDDTHSKEIDVMTQQEYQASKFGPPNKNSKKSGWPNGMENGKIRFIRLQYAGGDWDQDMGKNSDYNMLLKMKEYGGFKIADDTESIRIQQLANWKKNQAPPFVYLTGRGNISVTTPEVRALQKYLLEEGGMIFADNGGGHFDSSVRALFKRVLPNHDIVDVANDDTIYQSPFLFSNGAPPLWAHSGTRALGIKHNGRWIVFYHQGDINDAWKTGGSGVTPEIQERAFKMGANVIAYAFEQYLAKVTASSLFR